MAGLELAFLLVQPYRGHLCSYQLSAWERKKALGKYTLDDGMLKWCAAVAQSHGHLPCHLAGLDYPHAGDVHALVRTKVFVQKTHPGDLHTEEQRMLFDWASTVRDVEIHEFLFTDVLEVVPVSARVHAFNAQAGVCHSFPKNEIFYDNDGVSIRGADAQLLPMATTTVNTVLDAWRSRGVKVWMQDRKFGDRLVCLQVPLPFLHLVLKGCMHTLCSTDAVTQRLGRIQRWMMNHVALQAGACSRRLHISFENEMFASAAAMIRGNYEQPADDSLRPTTLGVLHWLDSMAATSKFGLDALVKKSKTAGDDSRKATFDALGLLRCLKLATRLTGDKHLAHAVDVSAELLGFHEHWLAESGASLPSRQLLQARRFHFDAAFCDLMKDAIEPMLKTAGDGSMLDSFTTYMLADSSPRVGKEWLLSEVFIIDNVHLRSFVSKCLEIRAMHLELEEVDHDREADVMKELRAMLKHHIMIPTGMGSACMGLNVKCACLFWAMRQGLAKSFAAVKRFMQSVVSVTTDFGTESGLGSMPPTDANAAFPWLRDGAGLVDESLGAELPDDARCSFSSAMSVPGTEHLAHNSLKTVVEKMALYKEWEKQTKEVSRALTSGLFRDRIKQKLLSAPGTEHLQKHLDKSFRKPLEHRFLNIQNFLEDILPMKFVLRNRWDHNAIFGNGVADDGTENVEREVGFVDQPAVTRAILSDQWWMYAAMLHCVGHGPEHVVFLSRGCPCHKVKVLEGDGCLSTREYICQQRELLKKHWKLPCPCKGLNAPWFAIGKARAILADTFRAMKRVLMLEFDRVVPALVMDKVMNDYEKGAEHITFEALLKLSLWEQLPLSLCSMAYPEKPVAIHHMKRALEHYDASSGDARHVQLVHKLLGPGRLRAAIERWIESQGEDMLDELQVWADRFFLVRTNEISVESLHRQGAILAACKGCHDAPYLSFHLRCPEVFGANDDGGGLFFSVKQWAERANSLRNDFLVMHRFGLDRHPVMDHWQSQQVLAGRPQVSGAHGSHKLIRQCFYRCDLHSMFSEYPSIQADIDAHSKRLAKDDRKRESDPVAALQSRHVDVDTRVEGMLARYAMRHLKEVTDEDSLLTFPWGKVGSVQPMLDVLAPPLKDDASQNGLMDEDVDLTQMMVKFSDKCRHAVFRVLALHPKRRRIFTTASNTLRSDHVAVAMYKIDARDASTRSFNISSSNDSGDVRMLGAQTLLEIGSEALKPSVLKCQVSQDGVYHFSGVVLPPCCQSMLAWKLLTVIVSCGAYPGPDAIWQCSPRISDDELEVLDAYRCAELISLMRQGGYRLTDRGLSYLKRSRQTHGYKRVFQRRDHLSIEGMTTWEILDWLKESGWKVLPMPWRQAVEPLMLEEGRQMVGTVYFNSKFEVAHDYVLVLARNGRLADKGLKQIRHKMAVSYYKELASCLRGGGVPLTLSDLVDDSEPMVSLQPELTSSKRFAIEDMPTLLTMDHEEEGEPDSEEEVVADAPEPPPVDGDGGQTGGASSDGKTRWGPFVFTDVTRVNLKTGELVNQWQVRCPFHKDELDASGTQCTKTCGYKGEGARDIVLRKLKAWCLAGRHKTRRADVDAKEDSHKFVDFGALPVKADGDLDRELADGLASPHWIHGMQDLVQQHVDAADVVVGDDLPVGHPVVR